MAWLPTDAGGCGGWSTCFLGCPFELLCMFESGLGSSPCLIGFASQLVLFVLAGDLHHLRRPEIGGRLRRLGLFRLQAA